MKTKAEDPFKCGRKIGYTNSNKANKSNRGETLNCVDATLGIA